MGYQTLLFEVKDGIAFITINRPDKLNALNDQVVDELADAAERVATEDAIKGAILSGSGQKAFVAGRISATSRSRDRSTGRRGRCAVRRCCGGSRPAANRSSRRERVRVGWRVRARHGVSPADRERRREVRPTRGQARHRPGYGGTQRLPRLVGKGNALHLILTGEMIDAREAHRIGLVNQVVPPPSCSRRRKRRCGVSSAWARWRCASPWRRWTRAWR